MEIESSQMRLIPVAGNFFYWNRATIPDSFVLLLYKRKTLPPTFRTTNQSPHLPLNHHRVPSWVDKKSNDSSPHPDSEAYPKAGGTWLRLPLQELGDRAIDFSPNTPVT